uniref:Cyclic GMP-AMP synthase n=1 Tax=Phasianus colchicus TaxID=9054 RepID=A0A669QIT9_PHACC
AAACGPRRERPPPPPPSRHGRRRSPPPRSAGPRSPRDASRTAGPRAAPGGANRCAPTWRRRAAGTGSGRRAAGGGVAGGRRRRVAAGRPLAAARHVLRREFWFPESCGAAWKRNSSSQQTALASAWVREAHGGDGGGQRAAEAESGPASLLTGQRHRRPTRLDRAGNLGRRASGGRGFPRGRAAPDGAGRRAPAAPDALGAERGGGRAAAAGGAVAAQPGPAGRVGGVGAGEPRRDPPDPGRPREGRLLQLHREAGSRQLLRARQDVDVTVKRKKPGSPAITLQINKPPAEISVDIILALEVQQSWPPSTQDGLNIECWLGRKVRRDFRYKPIYLVAKQNKKEKLLRGNTWRISFSHIEKAMLNNHGSIKTCCESDGVKCCRKDCLKLLKYLLERLKMKHPKELEKFCSYHVKTAFFHSCVAWPSDTDWQHENLEHCFQKYLEYFLRCLQDSQLPHFFIPRYNLLSLDDKASNDFLSRQINYQLNNGFPVFHQV